MTTAKTTAETYKLTKKGKVVLAVGRGLVVIALGFAILHTTARVVVWLGQTFFGY